MFWATADLQKYSISPYKYTFWGEIDGIFYRFRPKYQW